MLQDTSRFHDFVDVCIMEAHHPMFSDKLPPSQVRTFDLGDENAGKRRFSKQRVKPPFPYPYLITEILREAERPLTLSQICQRLKEMYPEHYGHIEETRRKSWQSTLRFNLSQAKVFERIKIEESDEGIQVEPRQSRGRGRKEDYWYICKETMERLERRGTKWLQHDARSLNSKSIFEHTKISICNLLNS